MATPRAVAITAFVCALSGGLASASPAVAADPVAKVIDLNHKAMEAFEAGNNDKAKKTLAKALDLCGTSGLETHNVKALTHVHLGIVFFAGFNQPAIAQRQFRKAFETDPHVAFPGRFAMAEIEDAFNHVRSDMGIKASPATAGASEPTGPAAEEPAPPPPPEPDISSLKHEPVTEAVRGKPLPIKASVAKEVTHSKVVLFYRGRPSGGFKTRDLTRDGKGAWAGEVPADATRGTVVAYYLEVQNDAGKPLAASGSRSEPFLASVVGDGTATAAASPEPVEPPEPPEPAPAKEVEETPRPSETARLRRSGDAETPEQAAAGSSAGLFATVAVGSGVGWVRGYPEVHTMTQAGRRVGISPGIAPAMLAHVAPELGYFIQPQIAVSVQLRLQFVTGADSLMPPLCGGMNATACNGPGLAIAVFGRASRWFSPPAPGKMRAYLSGIVGGGAIRHVVNLAPAVRTCGPERSTACHDTVRTGAFIMGGGGGAAYQLSRSVALTGGVDAHFAVPRYTVNMDLSLGLTMAF